MSGAYTPGEWVQAEVSPKGRGEDCIRDGVINGGIRFPRSPANKELPWFASIEFPGSSWVLGDYKDGDTAKAAAESAIRTRDHLIRGTS